MRTSFCVSVWFLANCLAWGVDARDLLAADVYKPGPPPTIGAIQSVTVNAIPLPRTRTVLGIGEQVTCFLDPATWKDVDYKIEEGEQPVDDAMGVVEWSAAGSLFSDEIVDPKDGNITTLMTHSGIETVTVTAKVSDSGTKGKDQPIEKTITFNVIAPDGVLALIHVPMSTVTFYDEGR